MTSIIDVIGHYQRSIEKSAHDEARLLHCIEKLYKLPITVEHLQQTGIGKTVNSLRKYDKEVGVAAKALVAKWKAMVAAEEDVVENDNHRVHCNDDDDRSNDNTESYNGSQSGPSDNSIDRHHKYKQSSKRNEKDVNSSKESKSRTEIKLENVKIERGHSKETEPRIEIKSEDVKIERGHRKKLVGESSSSSKHQNDKNTDRHHSDRRRDEKVKSLNDSASRRAHTPQPGVESPLQESEEMLYDNGDDDDDEDEEKLVIDTDKIKSEETRSKPSSSSKSSSHHKSSSKSKHNGGYHQRDSQHHGHSKSKTDDKDHARDSKKSTSSRNHSEDKLSGKEKSDERHQSAKSDKKDQGKSARRNSSDQKSSASSSRDNKHHEKSKEVDKKSSSSSSSKNGTSRNSKDKKSSSKRKRDSGDETDTEGEEAKKSKSRHKKTDNGIDSSMGNFSFEQALGMIAPPAKAAIKLKSPKANGIAPMTPASEKSSKSAGTSTMTRSKTPPLLTPKTKLEPLDLKLSFDLPTISPNYKPLPLNPTVMDCVFSNAATSTLAKPPPPRRIMTDDEALQNGISSKTIRTKIYSGIKSGAILQVPTLFKLCIRVLQKNIDGLEYTGGVPYDVLKPVLQLATPKQLQTFEEYNPYLLEDTDDLWQIHCTRRYKNQRREEMETWREMYVRCNEQEAKRLNMIAKNITFQQKQITAPKRRTQLAYIDVDVKPPRNIQRKQEQYGTKGKMTATPASRVESLSRIAPTIAKLGDTRLRIAAETRDYAQASSHVRPKKAPLMAKTLQSIKSRFKR